MSQQRKAPVEVLGVDEITEGEYRMRRGERLSTKPEEDLHGRNRRRKRNGLRRLRKSSRELWLTNKKAD